jgi:AraC-like DNA-binding protein
MTTHPLAAERPRTIPLDDVANHLGISRNAVKRAIQDDTEDRLPDAIRRIPGGRVQGASYYVIARQFELVTGQPEPIAPPSMIHTRKSA